MCGHSSSKILICVDFLFQTEFKNSIQQSGQSWYKGCSNIVNEQRDFYNPFTLGQKVEYKTDGSSNCI